jgi:hypothetical protein
MLHTNLPTRLRGLIARRYVIAACIGGLVSLLGLGLCSMTSHDQAIVAHVTQQIETDYVSPLSVQATILASCSTFLDFGLQGICLGAIAGVIPILVFDGLQATIFRNLLLAQSVTFYTIGLIWAVAVLYSVWGRDLILGTINFSHQSYPPAVPLQIIDHPGKSDVQLAEAGRYEIYFASPQLRCDTDEIATCSLRAADGRLIPLRIPTSGLRVSSDIDYAEAYEFVVDHPQTVTLMFKYKHEHPSVVVVPEGRVPFPNRSVLVAGCDIKSGSKLTQEMVDGSGTELWTNLPADVAADVEFDRTDWVARRTVRAGEPILCRDFTRTLRKKHL